MRVPVLPDPVGAAPMTFSPRKMRGIHASCTGVGVRIPNAAQAFARGLITPNCFNVFAFFFVDAVDDEEDI
jgi:hypothetical protein